MLLLDPMLATGGSASVAIQYLLNNSNVSEDHIIFVNLVASPAGIVKILEDFPKVRILTAEIDPGMNERAYIVPGLGDFGCRYYGTDGSD